MFTIKPLCYSAQIPPLNEAPLGASNDEASHSLVLSFPPSQAAPILGQILMQNSESRMIFLKVIISSSVVNSMAVDNYTETKKVQEALVAACGIPQAVLRPIRKSAPPRDNNTQRMQLCGLP